jgi:hypothetical protein
VLLASYQFWYCVLVLGVERSVLNAQRSSEGVVRQLH